MTAALEVSSVTLHYGAAVALRGVSVSTEAGAVTCVMGRNGRIGQRATFQREEQRFDLRQVSRLRLTIVPNKSGSGAASLTTLRLFA